LYKRLFFRRNFYRIPSLVDSVAGPGEFPLHYRYTGEGFPPLFDFMWTAAGYFQPPASRALPTAFLFYLFSAFFSRFATLTALVFPTPRVFSFDWPPPTSLFWSAIPPRVLPLIPFLPPIRSRLFLRLSAFRFHPVRYLLSRDFYSFG